MEHYNRFIGETSVVAFRQVCCCHSCCYVPRTCS